MRCVNCPTYGIVVEKVPWAGKFIDKWTEKVMYSNIEPMKKIAKTIRKHKPLILNWFKSLRLKN
jgi:hypothetical protein